MAVIRVTKEFNFEMAHALFGYDGPCKHIHGHSYKLFVTVKGEPITDSTNSKWGMLIDFGDLKRIVNQHIVDVFDHALVLNQAAAFPTQEHEMFGDTLVVDYQPTCENIVVDFADRIKAALPEGVVLHSLRLYETATSYADWFAEDN